MWRTRRGLARVAAGLGAATLVGLAGCDDLPNETRPAGSGGPGVTIVSTDEAPDLPVRPSVEIVCEAATTDHPPRLRTTLGNTGSEPIRVGEGRAVHFEHVTSDDGLLTLLPPTPDRDYPAESDCWRLTENVAITEEYRTFEIAAGESSSRPVDLYATPDADGCLPVGEHRSRPPSPSSTTTSNRGRPRGGGSPSC